MGTTIQKLKRMTVNGLAGIGLMLLMSCTPPGPRALLKGEQLIREGKYQEAVERLKVATSLLPQNAQAWNHLGLAYHGLRQPHNAEQAYQRALALDRDLAAARFNLGCLWLENHNPAAALAELTTYTLLQPNAAEGWVKLGLAQSQLRQQAAADKSFNNALRLQPQNPEAWNGLGMLSLQRNRPNEALNYFSAALQRQTNYGPALLNQAIVHHQYYKNLPVALQKYREYLALKPAPADAPSVLETVKQLQNEMRPATASTLSNQAAPATQVASLPPPSKTATQIVAKPNPNTASGTVPTTPEMNKTSPPTSPVSVAKAETPPDQVKSNQILPAPTPKTPNEVKPEANGPSIVNLAHRTPPARLPGIESPPVKVESSLPATTSRELEQPTTRLAQDSSLTRSTRLLPADNTAILPAPEPSTLNTNTTAKPDSNASRPTLAQRMNPSNWFRGSAKPAPRVTPLPPLAMTPRPSLRTTNTMGQMSVHTPLPKQPLPARYPYRSPAKPSAGNRRAAAIHLVRAVSDQREEHLGAAIAGYEKAIQADPSYFDAHYNLGLAAYQADRLPISLLHYEYALVLDPDSFNARYNFALALQKANYPRDAANELEKLLPDAPSDTRLHLLLANLYAQQLFQPQLARDHYLRVLELEPTHSQATAIRYWLAANPPR